MTLCRKLQLPVRSFNRLKSNFLFRRCYSTREVDPLRILFCGSDDFSIASLRAVHHEHIARPDTIASIDVVCRPGKRTGRGLKQIREVPIKHAAQELELPVHKIDTFTGWTPPKVHDENINLIIAVSFGLFVPPRILNGAKYGGLNVHPSLLPDLRGAAPIHHALLRGDRKFGISVQTLHPKRFDHGVILAQTPYPGFDVTGSENFSAAELEANLAPIGGDMLVQTLRESLFVPPLQDLGWFQGDSSGVEFTHAPKITSGDKQVDWTTWSAEKILRYLRVLGSLWDTDTYNKCLETSGKKSRAAPVRIIYHAVEEALDPRIIQELDGLNYIPGNLFAWASTSTGITGLYMKTCDKRSRYLRILDCTIEGKPKGKGGKELEALLKVPR